MQELIRTNDVALISAVEGILLEAGIPYQLADRGMSVIEGSTLFIQTRILVPDEFDAVARQLLVDAELGEWLRPQRS